MFQIWFIIVQIKLQYTRSGFHLLNNSSFHDPIALATK